MPDVYATIAAADETVQEQLATVMELRAADVQQRAMLDDYLGALRLPADSDLLEVGCGTGAVCRVLGGLGNVRSVVGVDPSPVFLAQARELGGDARVSFEQGDGRSLRFPDAFFDAVVFHTVLCHVPGPDAALTEAFRVLKPSGQVVVFDGDYATTTVAVGDDDPLQSCIDSIMGVLLHDRWLVRHLRSLLTAAGFEPGPLRSHGYVETAAPSYMLTLVDRGADAMASQGKVSAATAAALKDEARHRVQSGTFFGHIAYASIVGRKPAN